MLLRNKRKLLSVLLTIVLFVGVYFVSREVKLQYISKNIIRGPDQESSTIQQLSNLLKTGNNDDNYNTGDQNRIAYYEDKEGASGKNWESIMPSMTDPDAKKELGRASWKYFHTLLARFPENPTEEERQKLEDFVQLYAELYPCGECSYHFQKILKKHPVQTSSRTNAAMWGCHIHNIVNEHLKKDIYDCSTILEDYDCGCE
ncbi:hypothetical protein RI543_001037 [Arxiozyma heterogenica]|uniref:Sulfhydryl oxidase n=1 Tax=Arxiozyma heterogenica TaxID=278026 RepID=A0AAN7W583_9SACH|nr:hypothetical protein RI543_001037 [Kazachstania heterogenica]